jgi:hypothetical protein
MREKVIVIPSDTPAFTAVHYSPEDMIQISVIAGNLPINNVHKTGLYLSVEPVCVLWLQHRGIASVHVGNSPRRTMPLPDGMEYVIADWWKQGDALSGPLLINPGFNCRVYQKTKTRLQIEAATGSGSGEVTADLAKGYTSDSDTMVYEEPPADYLRKDGLLNDVHVLYAFCGAAGPHIRMTSGNTVQLTAMPATHTILIAAGNLSGDAC